MIGFVVGFAEDTAPAHPAIIGAANFFKVHAWTILIPFFVAALYWANTKLYHRYKNLWRDLARTALANRAIALMIIAVFIVVLGALLVGRLLSIFSVVEG